ncbi:hypothetical protein [Dechloromonas sp. HYN0024]|uniref:hypothetical protein n=1 Tax=Dechloromonas sp. HYN0024 TaxID=2231055 RepID=UPI000E43FB98|nr:hypothetical protein [Dechloromonas sp. HYN0024]AXS78872.1 hypothetical protein HYN24_01775 [Dechloromonas sp. HYN0024]
MTYKQMFLRLGLATILIGSLGACAVAPYPAAYHRAPPVYVQTYPGYAQPSGTIYYNSAPRYYEDRGGRYYDDRRYNTAPSPSPMQLHRDIRQSLGLPRPNLPGLP